MPARVPLLHQIRQNLFLATILAKRDLLAQYSGSAFGFAWAFLQPLAMTLIYAFLFSTVFKASIEVQPPGLEHPVRVHYTVWLMAALLPWTLFAETVGACAQSVINRATLVTKTTLPLEILPISALLGSVAKHGIGLIILAGLMAVTGTAPGPLLPALAFFFACCLCLSLGVGFFVAALNVYLRDAAQVVQVVLQLFFFLTPIFYRPGQFPQDAFAVIALNPMSYVVEGYRLCLIGVYDSPRLFAASLSLVCFAAVCLVTLGLGALLFKRLKSGFADVL